MQVKDDRLARLERELKYTRWAMLTLALIVLGCSGVTERFERCFSREYVIESKSESPLGRFTTTGIGGALELADTSGKTRIVIDTAGIRVLDPGGKVVWASPGR